MLVQDIYNIFRGYGATLLFLEFIDMRDEVRRNVVHIGHVNVRIPLRFPYTKKLTI